MNRLGRYALFALILFLALLLGSVLGRVSGYSLDQHSTAYRYISTGYSVHLPLHLDIQVLTLDLKLALSINALSLLTVILTAILLYRLK